MKSKKPILSTAKTLILVCAFALVVVFATSENSNPPVLGDCPDPPVVTLSPNIPADVCLPKDKKSNSLVFFDDYSWKIFIALTWPAKNGQRGVADAAKPINAPGPRVFETYKGLYEIFLNDASQPSPWNQYDASNACGMNPKFGQLVLASYSMFSNLGQAGLGKLVGPLPAQNKTFTRYLTGFDEIEFNTIVNKKWYLKDTLKKTKKVVFPDGSIDIKTAWIDMEGIVNKERYFTDTAIIMDPETGVCSKRLVGLVGMHIVQKTPTRPQWIWSSFEQVDNIKEPGATAPYAYDDGKGGKMPEKNPNKLDPLTKPPVVFNVQRIQPVSASTQHTNALYQAACRKQNSVWQYYKLVVTQWPTPPNKPDNEGDPDHTIPGTGSDSTAYCNLTMETFDQVGIDQGCMSCHNLVQDKADFLWSLKDHAGPKPAIPNFAFRKESPALAAVKKEPDDKSLEELKLLLQGEKLKTIEAKFNKQK